MKNAVITIARQYGSGGKTIAAMLAKDLGINCYGREILKMTLFHLRAADLCQMIICSITRPR